MANEKDSVRTEAPALDAGLVRKANDAYFGAGIAAAATFPYTDDQMFRMANALRVAADAAYGAVIAAINAHENSNPNLQMWAAQVIASDVRARLLAPAKSPWESYIEALEKSYPDNPTAISVAKEVRSMFAGMGACELARAQAAEVQRLRELVRVLREVLNDCAYVLEALGHKDTTAVLTARVALAQTEPRP